MKKELTELQKLIYDLNQKGFSQKKIGKLIDRPQPNIYLTLKAIEKKGYSIVKTYTKIKKPIPKIKDLLT